MSLWNALMAALLGLAACLAVVNLRIAVRQSSARALQANVEARRAEEAREAAEDLNRAKSEFMALVSHELRTPLNAVIGYSELLREAAQDGGRDEDAADQERVLEAASRLLAMVNGMLRLSALENGAAVPDPEPCNVEQVMQCVGAEMAGRAAARGNELCVRAETVRGWWRLDGEKLDECIRELVDNAVKFTRDGRVILTAEVEDNKQATWLVIRVEDTGVGIEPDRIGDLFRPFGLGQSAMTRTEQGIGLGLALTQQLARAMGGEVTVSSAPGQGSVFVLRVPASAAGPRASRHA